MINLHRHSLQPNKMQKTRYFNNTSSTHSDSRIKYENELAARPAHQSYPNKIKRHTRCALWTPTYTDHLINRVHKNKFL